VSPCAPLPRLLAALLLLFLGLPVVALLARSLIEGSLAHAIADPAIVNALVLSLGTTAVSLALTVLLGTPLAWALARGHLPGSRWIESLVDLPIVLPPAVAGLALLLLFGSSGPIGSLLGGIGLSIPFTTTAVVLAQLFVAAPFYVRSARTGFAQVPRDLEDAARVDGADEASVFRHVTVPLAAQPLSAGVVLSWARALGEFGATIMFAGNVLGRTQTLPLAVYAEFQSSLDGAVAAAVILVIAALAVLLAVRAIHWRSVAEIASA
jgi:molybdate transport system permease protein